MSTIGFICNLSPNNPPSSPFILFRAIEMAKQLKQKDYELFIYNPADTCYKTQSVSGFIINEYGFEKLTKTIPDINGNFFVNPRSLVDKRQENYQNFWPWIQENNKKVYPTRTFSNLVTDKYITYILIDNIHNVLQPLTEIYQHQNAQLYSFIKKYPTVFLKPLGGSMGNNVLTIEQKKNEWLVTFYKNKRRQFSSAKSRQDLKKIVDPC